MLTDLNFLLAHMAARIYSMSLTTPAPLTAAQSVTAALKIWHAITHREGD